jgi:hypothetical protein
MVNFYSPENCCDEPLVGKPNIIEAMKAYSEAHKGRRGGKRRKKVSKYSQGCLTQPRKARATEQGHYGKEHKAKRRIE